LLDPDVPAIVLFYCDRGPVSVRRQDERLELNVAHPARAFAWSVKPDKAEAIYAHGPLRIEVPFKDPMEDAGKVSIKARSRRKSFGASG
jgi:hypothetical protein